MSLTKESLQEQLKSAEDQLEQAKAVVYRCDGAVQAFQHMLVLFDTLEPAQTPVVVEPPVVAEA